MTASEQEIEEDLEEEFDLDFSDEEGERTVSTSFKQGFGFMLGLFFALLIIGIVVIVLTYAAMVSGIITLGDLGL